MRAGDKIKTSNGLGVIKSIGTNSVEVLVDGKAGRYDIDTVDLVYDPVGKLLEGRIDGAIQFILGIDAHRLYTEYQFNPYVLASSTKIKIFPHQIEEVIWGLDNPRMMIADEVGLGKTIIAALIISELRARGTAKRLLFVVPKALVLKWKKELEWRFRITTNILDREYVENHPPPFGDKFSLVTSIDYLKQDHVGYVLNQEFDAIVVDEAHKLVPGTARMNAARTLASNTNVLIFLTATPHDGKDEVFIARMNLLDKFVNDIESSSYLWIRTTKEDVVDMDGHGVFPDRTSKTINVELSPQEREINGMIEEYFDTLMNNAKTPYLQNIARFLTTIYRKRASSSFQSLKISLGRRIEKLGNYHEREIFHTDLHSEDDDEDDDDRLEKQEGSVIMDPEQEIQELRQIISKIESISHDTKLIKLKEIIKEIKRDVKNARLVLFTEYRDTLDHLEKSLVVYKTGRIDGTMTIDDREAELERFRKTDGCEIMVCTDAAGEGIDMQFCNVEINYDIPWNPNRLEQRMGRIHRIGQDQNVYYYNFIVDKDHTIDGFLIQNILVKMEQIKAALQGKVYDVIGLVFNDIEQYYHELRGIAKNEWEPIIRRSNEEIEANKKKILQYKKMLLEGRKLDTSNLENLRKMREDSVVIGEVKRFLETFLLVNDGKITPINKDQSLYRMNLPEKLAQELDQGVILGTFDPVVAEKEGHEYLALGTPSVEKIIRKALSDYVTSLSHETQEGILCVYKISIVDGQSKQVGGKIVALFERADGVICQIDDRAIWSYEHADEKINSDMVAMALKRMEPELTKVKTRIKSLIDGNRATQKENSIRSLKHCISKKVEDIDHTILGLDINEGPHIEKIIREKKRIKQRLKIDLQHELEKRNTQFQTTADADLIGIAQIFPDDGMAENLRIDKAGMKAVLDYEWKRAKSEKERECIKDVSTSCCGYDVRSFGRKIEVKSHRSTGDIILTSHEWATAQRLKEDYWLYIVEDVFDTKIITLIKNPAVCLSFLYKTNTAHGF